ncbi:endonuclease domain-containing protein [Agromyces bauzanensis]
MRRPRELPTELATLGVFPVAQARALGVTRGRLAASDLVTPNRGVRRLAAADPDLHATVLAFAARMTAGQFFSHSTAARLNDVPLPAAVEADRRLHVSVLGRAPIPRIRGVIGHRLDAERTRVISAGGVQVTDAATTWCQLASTLSLDDLVAAGDHMLTGGAATGGVATATIATLTAAAELHRRSPGALRMRKALPLLRVGPLSRRESLLRLRMLRHGLPEPQLNHPVPECRHDGRVPHVDFAYPDYRVAIEYEGDYHRTPEQFRRHISRHERLQDAGWIVIRAAADDVPDDPAAPRAVELVERIELRLRSRGWHP